MLFRIASSIIVSFKGNIMYIYKTMGSMSVPVEAYIITTEGVYSKDRIPCLDALVGTMLELKMGEHAVEPMSKELEAPKVEITSMPKTE